MNVPRRGDKAPTCEDLESELQLGSVDWHNGRAAAEAADELVVHGLLRSAAVDKQEVETVRIERLLSSLRESHAVKRVPRWSMPWPTCRRGIRRPVSLFAVTAAVAASLLLAVFLWQGHKSNDQVIARLTVHDDGVQLFDVRGVALRTPKVGQTVDLSTGQVVRTPRSIDSAVIDYEDGTRIELLGDAEMILSESRQGAKQLNVAAGLIQADVTPQPEGLPLLILTSTATLEVLGTSLGVDVNKTSTQLEVASGLVAMTRRSDGKRIEVAAGQLATATESTGAPLDAAQFPFLPDQWSEDFEDGLPLGWWAGRLVATESGWAVLASGDGHGIENNIAVTTQNAWREGEHGLFNLRRDSVLHIRFRQQRPAPLRLMLVTRAYPPDSRRRGVNLYYEDPSWNANIPSGQWQTISVPLSEVSYFGKRESFQKGAVGLEGLAAFIVQLTSMDRDIGLTVDRIWVTRRSMEKS